MADGFYTHKLTTADLELMMLETTQSTELQGPFPPAGRRREPPANYRAPDTSSVIATTNSCAKPDWLGSSAVTPDWR